MSRLIFSNPEHLQAAREFAERTRQTAQLEHVLDFQLYDERFEAVPDDWQKHRIMNGGVIYHGPMENGTRPETFAVTLTPENSWSIHT
jgi:hypothetical protein